MTSLNELRRAVALGAVVLAAVVPRAAQQRGQASAQAAKRSTMLAVAGRANAHASIAAAGSFVAITWSAATPKGVTDVYAAVSRDGGATFGEPVRVNAVPGEANINGEQPPRVALVPRASGVSIVVVWTAKDANATRLLTARSDNAGVSFGRASTVPGSDAPGNRGWESIVTDSQGRVAAIWLDHRGLADHKSMEAMHHGQHPGNQAAMMDGAQMAQLSALYFGRLDGSGTSRPLTSGVCYCCKTTLASGRDGSLYAAWRHVYPGNIRDIAFVASRDGGNTFAAPVQVSEDRWVIDGCPENGPAMAVDRANRIHILWPTLVSGGDEPALAMFYAMSTDGRLFTARQQIPTEGTPRHPQVAIGPDGAVTATWDEGQAGGRRVVVATGTPDARGTMQFVRQPLDAGENGSYPVVAGTGRGMIMAWTSGPTATSRIQIRSLP